MPTRPSATTRAPVRAITDGAQTRRRDTLVTEEPLEVRLQIGGVTTPVAVTMRTPGEDFALAAGLLYSEGIVRHREEIARIDYCTDVEEQLFNVVTVTADPVDPPDLGRLERRGTMSSACGVCGKTSLDAVRTLGAPPITSTTAVTVELLYELPDRLRAAQATFEATGGLHAAGLFTPTGELVLAAEDVGRHNAVDKVIGRCLLDGWLPLSDHVLVVSGRAGFEIAQKAVMAGIPVLASVSAPSSLAVQLADQFGLTLVGFLRGRRCNVYTGPDRILVPAADHAGG
ncbi:MAG TPA: formate dehydrogenase accessory sulfurtransferase FdhD [Mycobacteriales bacterium]|jgi:FdhD protein|nr:formate dehydrogenase accessory sulfurtransferase FdhD [Mycobacteriales bacterium]